MHQNHVKPFVSDRENWFKYPHFLAHVCFGYRDDLIDWEIGSFRYRENWQYKKTADSVL